MPPAANHDLARALLSALQAEPLTRAALLLAVQAEPSEHRAAHGVITGLINRGMVTQTGGMLHLTDHGRHQLKPAPPPAEKPPTSAEVIESALRAVGADPTASDWPIAAAELRSAVHRVGIQGRDLMDRVDLLRAAREAIDVMEQRSGSLITALRAIEAALPGAPTGLRADAIADRAVGLLHGCVDGAREREALRQERDDSQREYAALDDVFEGEKTLHAETRAALAAAEAEITRLRADLEGALAAEKATAEKLAEAALDLECALTGERQAIAARDNFAARANAADGPYWTHQGDRHTLSILRPVEIAVILVDPASVGWEAGQHSGRVVGSGPEAIDLAQRLAEVAAGVSS